MSALTVIEGDRGDGLPVYPFDIDLRLDTHHFFAFMHRRWLYSRLRLQGRPEIRGYAVDFFAICQDQTPVGTLPSDRDELATLLGVDRNRFDELCEFKIGVLYNWYLCDCEGEVRYTHGVVLEVIKEALKHKKAAADRSAAGTRRKRMNRLAVRLQEMGANSRIYANQAALEWLDEWLERECGDRNRTAVWIEKSVEAFSARS